MQSSQVACVSGLATGGAKPRTSRHASIDWRKLSTIYLERARKGHGRSGARWNCFKGNSAVTSAIRAKSITGISECIDNNNDINNNSECNERFQRLPSALQPPSRIYTCNV